MSKLIDIDITIENESIYDERRVALRINGAESLPTEPTGRFIPHGIIIAYGKPRGEEWRCIRVEVHGPKLTRTGGSSSTIGKKVWCGHDDMPLWVHGYVGKYWPLTVWGGLTAEGVS